MKTADALARLRQLGLPVVTTADAGAAFRESAFAASKTMGRLGAAGLINKIRHGLWRVDPDAGPLEIAMYLTQPFPSYVSLQTALYHHGMIEQIPSVVYLVSLDRARKIRTTVGAFSIHHVAPALFGGYVDRGKHFLATPEKALFDVAYLSGSRSRSFAALPELELPRGFRHRELQRWVAKIPSQRSKSLVQKRLEGWLSRA